MDRSVAIREILTRWRSCAEDEAAFVKEYVALKLTGKPQPHMVMSVTPWGTGEEVFDLFIVWDVQTAGAPTGPADCDRHVLAVEGRLIEPDIAACAEECPCCRGRAP